MASALGQWKWKRGLAIWLTKYELNSTHEIIFDNTFKYKQKVPSWCKVPTNYFFWTSQGLVKTKEHNSTCTIRANLSTWNKLANIRPEAMIDWRFLPKKNSLFFLFSLLICASMEFQRDLWNALHWSKNKPGSWYQKSNICVLLDSSEVRAYLPLRPSFIDSLIRPLVTIGFWWFNVK